MIIDSFFQKRKAKKGDSNLRSILKTVSWRIVGTVDTLLIAYFLTGEVSIALSIGSVEVFTKMLLYYLHERVWNKFV
ncbi:MAG: DUF2061 domain-containing protein [Flavobacteriales bacterium]|jgi:uncharacterized membrane protein|nr:DUF2061 domain-containing protein [Flavobacteriales bacterium]